MPPRPKCSPAAAQVLAECETRPWKREDYHIVVGKNGWIFEPSLANGGTLKDENVVAVLDAACIAANTYWKHARDQRALRECQAAFDVLDRAWAAAAGDTWMLTIAPAVRAARKAQATLAAVLEES